MLSTSAPDLPDRHRSFAAVAEYSLRLLSARLRQQLFQLAVLPADFDAATALQVAQLDRDDLRELTDHSLLRQSTAERYEMPRLLRRYAAKFSADLY